MSIIKMEIECSHCGKLHYETCIDGHVADPILCDECWREIMEEFKNYLSKEPCKYYRPEMAVLGKYCEELYGLPNCGAGGPLHILLDDNNYDDHSLEFCRKYCEEHSTGKEYQIAMKILDIYSEMNIIERTVFDWIWCGRSALCETPGKCETCDMIEIPWYIEEKQNE